MPETVQRFTVFLASPGDVLAERRAVGAAVEEINRTYGEPEGFVLTLKKWETHTRPASALRGGDSQDVIDAQIGDYDIFVGLMWTRFGTPTKKAGSGTEQEYEAARKAGKRKRAHPLRVMFYFRSGMAKVQSIDPDQLKAVRAFKAKVFRSNLAREYDTPAEFARLIREHLTHEARSLRARKRAAAPKPKATRPATPPPAVTPAKRPAPRKTEPKTPAKKAAPKRRRGAQALAIETVRPLLTDAKREAYARRTFNSLFQTLSKTAAEFDRAHAHATLKTTRPNTDTFEIKGQVEGHAAVHFRVTLGTSNWPGTWQIALYQASVSSFGGQPYFSSVETVYTASDDYTNRLEDRASGYLYGSQQKPPTPASVAGSFWKRINEALKARR